MAGQMTSRVSVIVDNFNYARYLPQALDSVLGQSLGDFECLVVDDGSQDASREIMEQYARADRRVLPVLKENGGQASAFSAGFARARGDIIAFLDSDDFWYGDKLEKIVAAHQSCRIVQHYLAPNGEGIYRQVRDDPDRRHALLAYGHMYNHSPCSALSFARECLEPFFPLLEPEKMRGYADGCLLMLAMTRAPVCILSDVLGFYRIHGENMHANRTDRGTEARAVLRAQRTYVNLQLRARGLPEIPFSDTAYIASQLRERAEALKGGKGLVVYGTEAAGENVTRALQDMGIAVFAYADSDAAKWGKEFCGREILSPRQLAENPHASTVIIASSATHAITQTLRNAGIDDKRIFPLAL